MEKLKIMKKRRQPEFFFLPSRFAYHKATAAPMALSLNPLRGYMLSVVTKSVTRSSSNSEPKSHLSSAFLLPSFMVQFFCFLLVSLLNGEYRDFESLGIYFLKVL